MEGIQTGIRDLCLLFGKTIGPLITIQVSEHALVGIRWGQTNQVLP